MSRLSLIINNIKLPVNASREEAFSVARAKLSKYRISAASADFSIYRRSIDARRKDNIIFVYSVAVRGEFKPTDKLLSDRDIAILSCENPTVVIGEASITAPPVVIGSGPCGLFAALMLAENGYRPILLERGGSVAERQASVERLKKFRILDPDNNIQFGAGGAGTFSDGKLVTRINDAMTSYVLDRFIEFGADNCISYIAKPHIGTDILAKIVDNMIQRIVSLGGEIRYHTKFLNFITNGGSIVGVKTTAGDIDAGAVVLAIGHSARDTYSILMSEDIMLEAKPFSVGMRIEHLADEIDKAMYGNFAGDPRLGHAEYNLSYDTKGRGVYTFCMCPGGVVVPATSEDGGVVVNGMSYSKRDSVNSNSAVVCSVRKEDCGNTPAAAIAFQRKIERDAFCAGGSDYSAPIITVGDFLNCASSTLPTKVLPSYMDGIGVRIAPPEKYLPDFAVSQIKSAIRYFDTKISGFASSDAVLTGAETRTSAPIRILRDPETRLAPGFDNLFPAGEGAGYAGGITSAAIDGIRSALALMKIYAPHHG